MLCYMAGPPAISYAKFCRLGGFDTLEAAKSSWGFISCTAETLSVTMDTDTWEQRSQSPLFTKEWDKVFVDYLKPDRRTSS